MLNDNQINILINGVRETSSMILTYYKNPDLVISEKEDHSPVTAADLKSHQFISGLLKREFPGIPLISEEYPPPVFDIRKKWEYCWILDPLDGTREFIAGNDEFAVNLALLDNGKPVFGIISIPAKNLLYYALKGQGSWKINTDGQKQRLPIQIPEYLHTRKITALLSRSHSGLGERKFLKKMEENGWQVTIRPTGSSYKQVLLAEGSAHLYAKPGICWEWDTAPGQLILEEAGGSAVRLDNGVPLVYNKEVLTNPDLIMWAPGVSISL